MKTLVFLLVVAVLPVVHAEPCGDAGSPAALYLNYKTLVDLNALIAREGKGGNDVFREHEKARPLRKWLNEAMKSANILECPAVLHLRCAEGTAVYMLPSTPPGTVATNETWTTEVVQAICTFVLCHLTAELTAHYQETRGRTLTRESPVGDVVVFMTGVRSSLQDEFLSDNTRVRLAARAALVARDLAERQTVFPGPQVLPPDLKAWIDRIAQVAQGVPADHLHSMAEISTFDAKDDATNGAFRAIGHSVTGGEVLLGPATKPTLDVSRFVRGAGAALEGRIPERGAHIDRPSGGAFPGEGGIGADR